MSITNMTLMSNITDVLERVKSKMTQSASCVFIRKDFKSCGSYVQVGRALRIPKTQKLLANIGYGLWAKTKKSSLTGEVVFVRPLPILARKALAKLGVVVSSTALENDYLSGRSKQVPTGANRCDRKDEKKNRI